MISSVGRAPALHAGGQGIELPIIYLFYFCRVNLDQNCQGFAVLRRLSEEECD